MVVIEETGKGRCSVCRSQWYWFTRLVQLHVDVQRRGCGVRTRSFTACSRRKGGGGGWSE